MDAVVEKIESLLGENSLQEAKKLLDDLLKEHEEELPLYWHYLIAVYHIKSLEYDLAVPHLLKIEESETSPYYLPQTYKLLGYCAIMQGDYSKGENILREFQEYYYSDADVQNMIAFVHYAQGRIGDALLQYKNVLTDDPDNLTARNGLACILVDYENKPEKALEILEPWGKQSEDPKVLDTLGWIYLCMGDVQKSEPYLRRAFDVIPTNPEVNHHMSLLMEKL